MVLTSTDGPEPPTVSALKQHLEGMKKDLIKGGANSNYSSKSTMPKPVPVPASNFSKSRSTTTQKAKISEYKTRDCKPPSISGSDDESQGDACASESDSEHRTFLSQPRRWMGGTTQVVKHSEPVIKSEPRNYVFPSKRRRDSFDDKDVKRNTPEKKSKVSTGSAPTVDQIFVRRSVEKKPSAFAQRMRKDSLYHREHDEDFDELGVLAQLERAAAENPPRSRFFPSIEDVEED
jgi:hypothetical protein